MVSAFFSYTMVMKQLPRRLDALSKEPVVNRETKYFQENIGKIKTVDDFIKDTRIFNYAMKAFGLDEMSYAKGLMKKILSDEKYAEKLIDKRYAAFRKTFDFNTYGEITTMREEVIKGTVEKYRRVTLEEKTGEENTGARLALYMDRRIDELIKDGAFTETAWAYQILGDKALKEAVCMGLNANIGGTGNIDAQKKALENKLSYKQLVDPVQRKKFIQRFLAMYDVKHQTEVSPALTVLQSFDRSSKGSLSSSTLMALQNLRNGF